MGFGGFWWVLAGLEDKLDDEATRNGLGVACERTFDYVRISSLCSEPAVPLKVPLKPLAPRS